MIERRRRRRKRKKEKEESRKSSDDGNIRGQKIKKGIKKAVMS